MTDATEAKGRRRREHSPAARRAVALVAFAIAVALAVPGLLRLENDNSPEVFFPRGSKSVERYAAHERAFGSDETARLVVEGPALFTEAGLRHVAELEEQVRAIPGVLGTRSPVPAEGPDVPAAAVRARVLGSPLARNLGTVARDGSALTVLVSMERLRGAPGQRLLERLEAAVAHPPDGLETSIVGGAVINRELDRSSLEIRTRYFPLLVAVAAILLAFVFRSLAGVAVPLLFVAASEGLTLGAMGWAGVRLNLVLTILPPLLFVIALATSVHVFARFRDLRAEGLNAEEAVRMTFRDSSWALAWAGLSTVIGFGSLLTSQAGPVRQLGLWAAIGIALMTAAAFTLLPALLAAVSVAGPPPSPRAPEAGFGGPLASWSVARRPAVLLVVALTSAAGIAGFSRLEVESNALHYFPKDRPVRAKAESLEERGIAFATADLVLSDAPGSLRSVEALARLSALAAEIREDPAALGVVSAGDVFDEVLNEASRLVPAPLPIVQAVALGQLGSGAVGADFGSFFANGDRTTRVIVFVRQVGYEEMDALAARMTAAAARHLPGAKAEMTGQYPLLLETQASLLRTLALSLGGAVLCTLAIFCVALRSLRLALLALLPNVWQVLVVVGAVGLLGIRVDIATVMVASIVVGLSVDDTLRTVGHLRHLVGELGAEGAVVTTLRRTAGSYVLTGAIFAMGFGACALSSFTPTRRFGILSAVAILLAVAADLVLVPALFARLPARTVRKLAA